MTDDEQDELLQDATLAVNAAFDERGVKLTSDDLVRINDFLTVLLGDKI